MSFLKGDRVLHRGMRTVGVVTGDSQAGQVEVRTSDGRLELWPLHDTLRDKPGADDHSQSGRGHISDPHDHKLAGAQHRTTNTE